MKVISLFSGCGGLDLGFEKADYDIELVNEYYKPFMEAYQYSRAKMNIPQPKYGYLNEDVNNFLTKEGKQRMYSLIKDARSDGCK